MNLEHTIKKFKKRIKAFNKQKSSGVEEIHDLRTACREFISLLDPKEALYKQIKKIIKISNSIRDIDVFFELYLPSLPKKYLKKLDMHNITKPTQHKRKKECDKLHKYLKSLDIQGDILFKAKADKSLISTKKEPNFDQEELHQYRIYIKKLLYREKNSLPINKKRVNILSKIKDCLGSINDNHNGYERCKECEIKAPLLKRIENFTQAKNLKLFQKFQILNKKFIGGAV
jgi:CHAD domain-containing protein